MTVPSSDRESSSTDRMDAIRSKRNELPTRTTVCMYTRIQYNPTATRMPRYYSVNQHNQSLRERNTCTLLPTHTQILSLPLLHTCDTTARIHDKFINRYRERDTIISKIIVYTLPIYFSFYRGCALTSLSSVTRNREKIQFFASKQNDGRENYNKITLFLVC